MKTITFQYFRKIKYLICWLFLWMVSFSVYAQSATFYWDGSTSSDWNDATNWDKTSGEDNDGLPDDGDQVHITSSYTNAPRLSTNAAVLSLDMTAGSSLDLNGKTLFIRTQGMASDVTGATITFSGGTISTSTLDTSVPYGALEFSNSILQTGDITMIGGLQFNGCTFTGDSYTLTHIGDSHFNGGNTFNGAGSPIILTCEETDNNGFWYWGNGAADTFHGALRVNSYSANNKQLRLADNAGTSIFHGNVEIYTKRFGSVQIANEGGNATFKGTVKLVNETDGINTDQVTRIGRKGTVIFEQAVTFEFTNNGEDEIQIEVGGTDASSVTFQNGITLINPKDANRYIKFGDLTQKTAGKQVTISGGTINLTDFEYGEIHIQNLAKTSTTTTIWGETTAGGAVNRRWVMMFSDWLGDVNVKAGLIHLFGNTFTENAASDKVVLTNYGSLVYNSGSDYPSSGKNNFQQDVELYLGNSDYKGGDNDWVWGYNPPNSANGTGEDIFSGNVTAKVTTTANRFLKLAHNSSNNQFKGNLTLTSEDKGSLMLANDPTAFATVEGNLSVNTTGQKSDYIASRGKLALQGDFGLNVTSTGRPTLAQYGGEIQFTGNSNQNFTSNNTDLDHIKKMVMNGTSNTLVLNSNLRISETLDLTSGKINTNGNTFTLGFTSISNENANGYIIAESGTVAIDGASNTNRLIPVGGSGEYLPLTINHKDAGNVTFSVSTPTGKPTNGASNALSNYWLVSHSTGDLTADVTLDWQSSPAAHYFMQGDQTDWGIVAGTGNFKASTQNNLKGVKDGFLGAFGISTSSDVYAGADITGLSACANLQLNAISSTAGSWSLVNNGGDADNNPAVGNTAIFSNVNATNTFVTTDNFEAGRTYTFEWNDGSNSDQMSVTISVSGTGGAPYQVWTGTKNNDWFDCNNWQGYTDATLGTTGESSVPGTSTTAVINPTHTSYSNEPIINTGFTAQTKFLTITNGGELNLNNETIEISGGLNIGNFSTVSTSDGSTNGKIEVTAGIMNITKGFFTVATGGTNPNGSTITIDYSGNASYPSFNGQNQFGVGMHIIQKSTTSDLLFGANTDYIDGGKDIFHYDLVLENQSNTDLTIAYNTTGNELNGNVAMINKSVGYTRIGHENKVASTATTLLSGKNIDASASTNGSVSIIRVNYDPTFTIDPGVGSHDFNSPTMSDVNVYIYQSSLGGDLDISAKNVELRQSRFGALAGTNTVKIHATTDQTRHCGGNIFYGATEIKHEGTAAWHWGYSTGGDSFRKSLQLQNNTTNTLAHTFLADIQNKTEIYGDAFITAKGSAGVFIAENAGSKIIFKGKTLFVGERDQNTGTDNRGLDAINVANLGTAIFEGDVEAKFTNAGISGGLDYKSYMSFAFTSVGHVTFNNLKLTDESNNTRIRGFYIGSGENKNGTQDATDTYNDQVILNGGITTNSHTEFQNCEIFLSNITQKNATNVTLTVPNAILTCYNSEFLGFVSVEASASGYRWNTFSGQVELGVAEPNAGTPIYDDFSDYACGGNTFKEVATIKLTSNNADLRDWEWGSPILGVADVFEKNTTLINTSDNNLGVGNGTKDNQFLSDLTVTNSGNGEITMAGTLLTPGDVNVTVEGNATFTNSNTDATKPIKVASEGQFVFKGNVTATSNNDGHIQFGYGTNGWIRAESTGTQTLDFNTAHIQTHKLHIESPLVSLANAVYFVTADANAELKFVSGRVQMNNYDLDLDEANLTGYDSQDNIIATGLGHLKRKVSTTGVVFPVANTDSYYPATLLNTGTADVLGVRIVEALSDKYDNSTNNTMVGNVIDSYFTEVGWVLNEETQGGTNLDLTIQWNGASDELPNFERTNTTLHRYDFVSATWGCGYGGDAAAQGSNPYTLNAKYGVLDELGVFAPSTPYVNAGADVTFKGCDYAVLGAIVPTGTGGVGHWEFVSRPATATKDPIITNFMSATSDITDVEAGTYTFKWVVEKPNNNHELGINCTALEDLIQVTITSPGSGTGTSSDFTTWTGATDSDWNNCDNWTAGTPGSGTAGQGTTITIPFTATKPDLITNVTVKSMYIEGGTLNFASAGLEFTVLDFLSVDGDDSGNHSYFTGTEGKLTVDASSTTTAQIKSARINNVLTLSAPDMNLNDNGFNGKNSVIQKIGTAGETLWDGGNRFNQNITIRNLSSSKLLLGNDPTLQNKFSKDVAIGMPSVSTQNIYFTTAFVTAQFAKSINLYGSSMVGDFHFGEGTMEIVDGSDQTLRVRNIPSKKVLTGNLWMNKSNKTKELRLYRDHTLWVTDYLKMTNGRISGENTWRYFKVSLRNPDPDAFIDERSTAAIGGWIRTYSKRDFSRIVDFSTVGDYHFPTGTGWHRPMLLKTDGTGTGTQEIIVSVNTDVYSAYSDNNEPSDTQYTNEFAETYWAVRHDDPDFSGFGKFVVQVYWRSDSEGDEFNSEAVSMNRYNYTADKWECIQEAQDATGNIQAGWSENASKNLLFISSKSIGDDVAPSSTNLGIFSLSSAKANTGNTTTAQQVAKGCASIELDASLNLESPIGGEWTLVSAKGLTTGTPFDDVKIANDKSAKTIVSILNFDATTHNGDYIFKWTRKCIEDCTGNLACGDGTPLSEAFVTVTATEDPSFTPSNDLTWTGAVSSDWSECANWAGGQYPSTDAHNVTIPEVTNGLYPTIPTGVTDLKSITITEGGKLDLGGQNITVESLDWESGFITGLSSSTFYTGGVAEQLDEDNGGTIDFPAGTVFMTGNFISVTNNMSIRKMEVSTNVSFFYTGGVNSKNGGNTFKEDVAIIHKGHSQMFWGREDTGSGTSGGKDIFEKNVYGYCNACATAPGTRETLDAPKDTSRPTLEDFRTNHDETVSYLVPDDNGKYYFEKSCDDAAVDISNPTSQPQCYTNFPKSRVDDPDGEFPDYPRKDNFDSNTGTSQDDFLIAFNSANQVANEADVAKSEENVKAAQRNVEDAYLNLYGRLFSESNGKLYSRQDNGSNNKRYSGTPYDWILDAKSSINTAVNKADERMGQSTIIDNYFKTNATAAKALQDARDVVNNVSSPCSCDGSSKTLGQSITDTETALDNAKDGIQHRLFETDETTLADQSNKDIAMNRHDPANPNSPSEDNKFANAANLVATCALTCADEVIKISNELRAAIRAAVKEHNATIPAPPSPETTNNYLYFAYNTQGNQFQDNTRFQVELCGRVYISSEDKANVEFTGANKKHHFHNRNGYWANAIRTGLKSGTAVNFTGTNSETYVQNQGPGWIHFAGRQEKKGKDGSNYCDRERGSHTWANGATLKLRNTRGRTFIGGCRQNDFANLNGNILIDDNDLDGGRVYLSNFRQIGLGTDNYMRVDDNARLYVSYNSSFDSNTELVNHGDESGQKAQIFVGEEEDKYEGSIIFNGSLTARHTTDDVKINDALKNGSGMYFHRDADVYYNADVLIENALTTADSDNKNNRETRFGSHNSKHGGHGYLKDGKTMSVGPKGFRTGLLEVSKVNQYGNTKQQFWMPPHNDTYIHPESGGAQPYSRLRTQFYMFGNNFEGAVHVQTTAVDIRSNTFNDTTYIVNYGGLAQDGDLKSGDNTFKKKASFEFRYVTDLTEKQTKHQKPTGRTWYFGNSGKDTFEDELYIHNNGRNSQMGLAYKSTNNVFQNKVTIINGPGPNENVDDPDFFIAGGTLEASAEFQGDLIIENYSDDDFHIAIDGAHKETPNRTTSNFITIGRTGVASNLIIRNKIHPYYTGSNTCKNYRGDVLFGGPAGGYTTIEDKVNVQVENFTDGLLRFEKVTFKGDPAADSPLDFDLTGQKAGDEGNARLQVSFSSVNKGLEARSVWIQSDASTYEGDVSFQKTTMHNCNTSYDITWMAHNKFNGFFRLEDIATNKTQIVMAYDSPDRTNLGDYFGGNAVFTVVPGAHTDNRIIVADKYLSEFAGNVALNFNTITPISNTTYANPSDAGHYAGMKFTGNGSQTLTSSHLVDVNNLYVFQANDKSRLFVNQNVNANVRAYFNYGKMIISVNDVFIGNSDDKNSVEVAFPNQGHIVANGKGTVNRNVNNVQKDVLFPIGNLTNYLPVTLYQKNSGTSDMFRSRLLDNVYTTYDGRWDNGTDATFGGNDSFEPSDDPQYNPINSPTPIDRNFVRRSWVVTEDVTGGTDGQMMLQWFAGSANIATDEPPGFDREQTTIVHYKADDNEWRCMEFISAAREDTGIGTIQRRALTLVTNNTGGDDESKMGVFSVGSLTSGADNEISTCGAGATQLTAAPLSPPLYGTWELITVVPISEGNIDIPDPTGTTYFEFQTSNGVPYITAVTSTTSLDFMTGLTFSSVTDPNALIDGLQANMGYRFRWQNIGLGVGTCDIKSADILVRTGSFTSVTGEKTLVWRGADEYFWDCENWYVEGNPTDYSLPSAEMRLVIPEPNDAVTGAYVGTPVSGEVYSPVLFDRIPLTVKSIQIKNGSSFDLGGSRLTTTNPALLASDDKYSDTNETYGKLVNEYNANTRLTVSEFISIEPGGRFGNHYETVVEGDLINYGTLENELLFHSSTGIDSDGKTSPVLQVKGDFYNLDSAAVGSEPAFTSVSDLSQIQFSGNVFNEGLMFHSTGDVHFISGTSFISGGSDISLNKVFLNKDNLTDDFILSKTTLFITQGGEMTFTKGRTFTHSNYANTEHSPSLLAFEKDASESSVANAPSTFVRGPVSKYFESGVGLVNQNFEFPIGKADKWGRAFISIAGGSPDFITAEYFNTPYTLVNTAFIQSTVARPLTHVSRLEHWMIDRSNLANNNVQQARVHLYWESGPASNIGGLTLDAADPYMSNLVVVHFKDMNGDGTYGVGDKWVNEGGVDEGGSKIYESGASSVAKGAVGSHKNQLISTFSPFTFGSDDIINPLPVDWLYVRAKLIADGDEALVQWGTSTEINNDYFEVQRSNDGVNFTVIGIEDATRTGQGEYAWIDEEPFAGIVYYRIRQVDFDGSSSFSKVVSLNFKPKEDKPSLMVYPNPTNEKNVNLLINSNLEDEVNFRIFNTIGEQIFTKTINLAKGINDIKLTKLPYMPSGMYVISADELFLKSKLIVE